MKPHNNSVALRLHGFSVADEQQTQGPKIGVQGTWGLPQRRASYLGIGVEVAISRVTILPHGEAVATWGTLRERLGFSWRRSPMVL